MCKNNISLQFFEHIWQDMPLLTVHTSGMPGAYAYRSLNKINMKSESTSTRKCLPEALPIRGDQWFPDFSSLNGQIWNLNYSVSG